MIEVSTRRQTEALPRTIFKIRKIKHLNLDIEKSSISTLKYHIAQRMWAYSTEATRSRVPKLGNFATAMSACPLWTTRCSRRLIRPPSAWAAFEWSCPCSSSSAGLPCKQVSLWFLVIARVKRLLIALKRENGWSCFCTFLLSFDFRLFFPFLNFFPFFGL